MKLLWVMYPDKLNPCRPLQLRHYKHKAQCHGLPNHANKGADDFIPCDCCATPRGRANQEQTARRGFEASLQTPKGKAQGFRNTDIGRQGRPATNTSNALPDIIVSHIAPRGSSIPPLDFSSDSGSVPPSTDVDGRWIERPADATTPREYA